MNGTSLNMAGGIREFGRSRRDALAVRDGDRSLTFAGVDARSSRLASGLLASGLRPGDPVVVLSGNRMEYVEIGAALAKAGLPMVPLNSRNKETDNRYVVEHCGARALILDDALVANVDGLIDDIGTVLSFDGVAGRDYEMFLETAEERDPFIPVEESDPFAISYTSGTTGTPKGVLLTHRGRVLTAYATAMEWGLGPGRRTMAVAPMYHGAGFSFAYAGVQVGGSIEILRSWDPEEFLHGLERGRVSTVFLVPTHAQQIRRIHERPAAAFDLSALETLYFNAAALPVALKEWVHEAFPGVGVHELYWSTECSVVTDLRPEDSLRKPGSVGHPWFMNEVRLLDDEGQPVGPGEPGELFARSPMLMGGYLNNPEATREAFNGDGFVTVGDIAVADEEGFISIVDRKKDMIIAGGVNIFSREIEEVLARHPQIDEVAVVGLPDDVYGERIAAFVVGRKNSTLDVAGLEQYVLDSMAKYKTPREWHVVDALPRNASGKVLKRTLREDYKPDSPGGTGDPGAHQGQPTTS